MHKQKRITEKEKMCHYYMEIAVSLQQLILYHYNKTVMKIVVLQFGTVATVTDYHKAYSVLDPCNGVTIQAR